jgi:hypothetical protein
MKRTLEDKSHSPRQTYTRQIRRGRAHKDRAFVLFTNMAVAKNRVTSSH